MDFWHDLRIQRNLRPRMLLFLMAQFAFAQIKQDSNEQLKEVYTTTDTIYLNSVEVVKDANPTLEIIGSTKKKGIPNGILIPSYSFNRLEMQNSWIGKKIKSMNLYLADYKSSATNLKFKNESQTIELFILQSDSLNRFSQRILYRSKRKLGAFEKGWVRVDLSELNLSLEVSDYLFIGFANRTGRIGTNAIRNKTKGIRKCSVGWRRDEDFPYINEHNCSYRERVIPLYLVVQ